FSYSLTPPLPCSSPFPYTTLFRSAVNGLLGMSVVIALVGIVNTMTLSIFERRRELGMVRALGMTRQQVGRMILLEAFVIGLLGTDRKSTRLNSSHVKISYAVFCLK